MLRKILARPDSPDPASEIVGGSNILRHLDVPLARNEGETPLDLLGERNEFRINDRERKEDDRENRQKGQNRPFQVANSSYHSNNQSSNKSAVRKLERRTAKDPMAIVMRRKKFDG